MDYLKIDEVAAQWGISTRRLQTLCAQGKIRGATRFGRAWMIPKGTPKPADGRTKAARVEKISTDMPMPRKTPFLHLTNLTLWFALLTISSGGFIITATYGRKKEETE